MLSYYLPRATRPAADVNLEYKCMRQARPPTLRTDVCVVRRDANAMRTGELWTAVRHSFVQVRCTRFRDRL